MGERPADSLVAWPLELSYPRSPLRSQAAQSWNPGTGSPSPRPAPAAAEDVVDLPAGPAGARPAARAVTLDHRVTLRPSPDFDSSPSRANHRVPSTVGGNF